jgi:hypothetical protein
VPAQPKLDVDLHRHALAYVEPVSPAARKDVRWSQPFGWGLLTAFDPESRWDLPDDVSARVVTATETALAVQVRRSQDVEEPEGWPSDLGWPEAQVGVVLAFAESPSSAHVDFEGSLLCPSGHLAIGDAENEQVPDVPTGLLRVQVSLFARECAEYVVLRLIAAD